MRLAIVGAGPAGLIAALAARRLGLDATVFEQAPAFAPIGGGIALQSNGLRVLDALGVLPALRPMLQPFRTYALERVGRGPLATVDVGALSVPHNELAVTARHELQDVLVRAVSATGVPIRFDCRCAGAVWERERVALHFTAGIERGFDAVIAADGVHSVLRASAGLAGGARALGWAALRGVVDTAPAADRVRELWGSDGRLFGIASLSGSRTYFYCSAPLGRWQALLDGGGIDAWVEGWHAYGAEVMALLHAVRDWRRVSYDEIREVRMRRWYRSPVVLVGDAAHAMAPTLGQGANSAMVDAFVLVHLLADAERDGRDVAWAARRYQRLRRRFVTAVQSASRWGGRLAQVRSPTARLVADALLRLQHRIPLLARRAALLGVGYHPAEDRYLSAASPRWAATRTSAR